MLAECGVKGPETEMLSFLAVVEARRGRLDEAWRCLDDARSFLSPAETGSYRLELQAPGNQAKRTVAIEVVRMAITAQVPASVFPGSPFEISWDLSTFDAGLSPVVVAPMQQHIETFGQLDISADPDAIVLHGPGVQTAMANLDFGESFAFDATVDSSGGVSRIDLIEGILDVARARALLPGDPEAAQLLIEGARERLEAASAEASSAKGNLGSAVRLLRQELARWDEDRRQLATHPSSTLRVGPMAEWFELPGGTRVSLRRRLAIRRVLDILIEKRLSAPGTGVATLDLFEQAWPDERLPTEIALRRVYVGIAELRKLGLDGVVVNQTDGYLIAPGIEVERRED